MSSGLEERRALLEALRNDGSVEALAQVEQLQALYHAEQMAGVSSDVYDAGKGVGEARSGLVASQCFT